MIFLHRSCLFFGPPWKRTELWIDWQRTGNHGGRTLERDAGQWCGRVAVTDDRWPVMLTRAHCNHGQRSVNRLWKVITVGQGYVVAACSDYRAVDAYYNDHVTRWFDDTLAALTTAIQCLRHWLVLQWFPLSSIAFLLMYVLQPCASIDGGRIYM